MLYFLKIPVYLAHLVRAARQVFLECSDWMERGVTQECGARRATQAHQECQDPKATQGAYCASTCEEIPVTVVTTASADFIGLMRKLDVVTFLSYIFSYINSSTFVLAI